MIPCDLFGFDFNLNEYEYVTVFIEFITTIKERRGWYFYDHYLHEDIYTGMINVERTLIQYLYPYLDDLKSIEVYTDEYKYNTRLNPDKLFLLDTIILWMLITIRNIIICYKMYL